MKSVAIFDWDGTLADTIDLHNESWKMLAQANGFVLPAGFINSTFGKRNLEIVRDIMKWAPDTAAAEKLSDQKEVFYRSIIRKKGLPLIAGAEIFLRSLAERRVPLAVASSTPRANLDVSLGRLRFENLFSALVCSEDVKHGKPAPDPFLTAAERLGASPSESVVFEDSVAGVEAAVAADMACVILATTNSTDFWFDFMKKNSSPRPRIVIKDFSSFGADDFIKLAAACDR